MDTEKLKQIGLNEKESKVYLALLELEDALVAEIAEKTRINRSLLYSILSEMSNKGIVTYIIRNNVRYYKAAEPEKILSMLKDREKLFKSILPELISLHKPKNKKPIVEILEGKDGIKTVLNDIIRIKKDWLAFGAPGKGPEILGPGVDAFEKERSKSRIVLNAIFMKTPEGIKRGKELAKIKNTNIRFMPEVYSPASNYVYGDRIAILFWYKEFPFAVRIIDKNLADSYRNHFKIMWASAEKSPK
jgi:sugar-specific transcriptional regulator TrmB